jgi:hypothetical protein
MCPLGVVVISQPACRLSTAPMRRTATSMPRTCWVNGSRRGATRTCPSRTSQPGALAFVAVRHGLCMSLICYWGFSADNGAPTASRKCDPSFRPRLAHMASLSLSLSFCRGPASLPRPCDDLSFGPDLQDPACPRRLHLSLCVTQSGPVTRKGPQPAADCASGCYLIATCCCRSKVAGTPAPAHNPLLLP